MQDPAPTEPVKPREYVQDVYVDIDPFWKSMDLPWYGAVSKEPCTERSLTVSYIPEVDGVAPEDLRTWWPEALVAEGWVETSRSEVRGNGYQSFRYDLPDGRDALLTIEPRHGLWWVSIVLSKAPDAPAPPDAPTAP